MAFPQSKDLESYVQKVLEDAALAGKGLEVAKITVNPAGAKAVVKIAVDADTAPSSDTLEAVSRGISQAFDDAEESGALNFGPGYTLEVSTPGLSEPLETPVRWKRNIGRLVKLPADFSANSSTDSSENEDIQAAKTTKKQKKKNTGVLRRIAAISDTEPIQLALIVPGGKNPLVELCALDRAAPAYVEVEFSDVPPAEKALLNLPFESYQS